MASKFISETEKLHGTGLGIHFRPFRDRARQHRPHRLPGFSFSFENPHHIFTDQEIDLGTRLKKRTKLSFTLRVTV